MLFGISYDAAPQVLVLSDSHRNREHVRQELEKAWGRVHIHGTRGTGEAQDMIRTQPFDLVVIASDALGKQDTVQWIRRYKASRHQPFAPVVVITANREGTTRVQLIQAGADTVALKPVLPEEFRVTVRSLLKRKFMSDELEHVGNLLAGLIHTVDARDASTAGHSYRVTRLSVQLAEAMGWSERQRSIVYAGALLHDIGKIGIPDIILRKPGPLTPDEMEVVQKHPILGAEILRPLRSLRPIAQVVRHHHERWDGTGYPDGLEGPETAPEARLVAVADSIDAMLSHRPYRPHMAAEEVRGILARNAGTQWDPDVVRIAVEIDLPGIGARLAAGDGAGGGLSAGSEVSHPGAFPVSFSAPFPALRDWSPPPSPGEGASG